MSSLPAALPAAALGLWDLDRVVLSPAHQRWMRAVLGDLQGSPPFRRRKAAEVADLVRLSVLAERLEILAIDARTTLYARLDLRVPVPCRAEGSAEVILANRARLVLRYPEEALCTPLPGFAFVEIESPLGVFHPNVGGPRAPGAPVARQLLCLGARIAAGTPVRELVLASYQALSMAAYHVAPRAGAGVMSEEAAHWWAANLDRVPLTREPFLAPAGGGASA